MVEQLYTVVCEFRGGTYCAQVKAVDEVEAVRRWAEKMSAEKSVPRASVNLARATLRELDDLDLKPVPLDGLQGVWCFGADVGASTALCNLVLTQSSDG
jgi:hypothetical protein